MNRSNLTFYLLGKKYGFNFNKMFEFVKESQFWDAKMIEEYQNKQLRTLIRHAYDQVPYYKKQFDALGIKPKDIQSKEDLTSLPIINKKVVADNFKDFFSGDFSKRKAFKRHSGGTTGVAFGYYSDAESWAISRAIRIREYEVGGLTFGKNQLGVLAGGSLLPRDGMGLKSKMWRYLQNFYSMPITRMTAEIMNGYINELEKRKIKFLRGYPTAVYSIAKYLVDNNRFLPLTSVFTTAEMLYDYQRDMIRKAFGCEVFNEYGCGDGRGAAYECDHHDGLHISFELSIMEILQNNKQVEIGSEGEIVLTSLYDFSFPLIRYAPGDMAIRGEESCTCGRKSPKLSKIIGRTSDIIEFSNGVILNGLSIPFEDWTDKIKRFQIIQTGKDKVEVLLIPLKKFSNLDEQNVYDIMHYNCGKGVEVQVRQVNNIPVPKSGKFRYVISQIPQ